MTGTGRLTRAKAHRRNVLKITFGHLLVHQLHGDWSVLWRSIYELHKIFCGALDLYVKSSTITYCEL